MRFARLLVCTLALSSLLVIPAAEAGSPPAVTAAIEGLDTSTDRGTLIVTGTKLNKFKTFTLATFGAGAPSGSAELLVKGRTQITLRLPAGLTPGSYVLSLIDKKGTALTVDFAYRVTGQNVTFGNDVIVGDDVTVNGDISVENNLFVRNALDVEGTAIISNSSGQFGFFDFGSAGGDVLVGAFASAEEGVGPQVRFSDSTGFPFVDIGTNGAGDFEIENQGDVAQLTIRQNGLVVVGQNGGSNRFAVNGSLFGGKTIDLNPHPADTFVLGVNNASQQEVLRVHSDSTGMDLLLGNAFKPGGGSWGVFSDARLKKDVTDVTGALDSLLKLRSVEYEYKDPASIHELPGRHVGFVAQEVEQVFPDWVGEKADGMKFVAVKGFESLTVAALRELRAEKSAEVQALREEKDSEIQSLRDENAVLRARLEAIEQALASLRAPRDEEVAAPDAR